MPTVLVVDDSPVDRRVLSGILQKNTELDVHQAADGAAALEQMESQVPDIVVTDLQMPQMDGLELVRAIREHHSEVPVVLVTGFGSEDLAVRALQQGAASYVPKEHLAEKLADTVQDLLSRLGSDRDYERLSDSMTRAEFGFRLENDPLLIPNLVELVKQVVASVQSCDSTVQLRVGMALEESLYAAMLRSNLELTPAEVERIRRRDESAWSLLRQRQAQAELAARRVTVDIRLSCDQSRVEIGHQGKVEQGAAPGEPLDMHAPENRGLILMRAFMDEVKYDDGGRKLTLVKRADV